MGAICITGCSIPTSLQNEKIIINKIHRLLSSYLPPPPLSVSLLSYISSLVVTHPMRITLIKMCS